MTKIKEKILLLVVDFLMVNLAFITYYILRVQTNWFEIASVPDLFVPMIILYVYWLLLFLFVGMYQPWFATSRFDEMNVLFKVIAFGIFVIFLAIFFDDYINNIGTSNRFIIFGYMALMLSYVSFGRLSIRSFQRKLLVKGIGRKNALLVGFNEKAHEIHRQINRNRALGIDIVAYISTKNDNLGKEYEGIKVVDTIDNIQKLIEEYSVKETIIALPKYYEEEMLEVISKCDHKGVGIKIVPDLYEIISGSVQTTQIYGFPLIDIMPQIMPVWEQKIKRVLDICSAIIILILSFPISLLTIIMIKLESPGPALFKQERSGLDNEPFMMYKFRSMRNDAEKKTGPVWAQKNDPRVTKVGKFIRKVRIDEIPQMINVLKGEMSLVGPRPERPFFVEQFAQEIPLYKKRLNVRPGVTGWAQVKHKYDESVEDVKVKLKYDLFYIENMSLRLDIKIIIRTAFTMLFGKGHFK